MVSKQSKRKELLMGLLFISPGLIGFFFFTLIPVVSSVILSFANWNFLKGFDAIEFIGIENYIRMFSDDWFLVSYKNNILFTLITVPVLIVVLPAAIRPLFRDFWLMATVNRKQKKLLLMQLLQMNIFSMKFRLRKYIQLPEKKICQSVGLK